MKTITLYPSRIGCPSLPGAMKGIVNSLPGVHDVKVHYETRTLDVTFDETKTAEQDIIKEIGRELGIAMQTINPMENPQEESPSKRAC